MGQPIMPPDPIVILLTGLPSSGKSTVGAALRDALGVGTRCQLLDGDELRDRLPPALGFSRADRRHQGERALYLSELLIEHGVTVIVAVIAPLTQTRRAFRDVFGARYLEVFLTAPRAVRVARDSRGVYARAIAAGDTELVGVDGVYELPADPDLRIDTSAVSVANAVAAIAAGIAAAG